MLLANLIEVACLDCNRFLNKEELKAFKMEKKRHIPLATFSQCHGKHTDNFLLLILSRIFAMDIFTFVASQTKTTDELILSCLS